MRERTASLFLIACIATIPVAVLAQKDGDRWLWKSKDETTEPPTTTTVAATSELIPITQNDLESIPSTNSSSDNADLESGAEAVTFTNGTTEVTGRSSKSFRFGEREARILNDSGKRNKNKLNIKGYIPIVSIDEKDKHDDGYDEDDSESPYPAIPIPGRPSVSQLPQKPFSSNQPQPVYPGPQAQPVYPGPQAQPAPSYPPQTFFGRPHEQVPNSNPVAPLPSQQFSSVSNQQIQGVYPDLNRPQNVFPGRQTSQLTVSGNHGSRPQVSQPSVSYLPQSSGFGQRITSSSAASSVSSATYLPGKPIQHQKPSYLPAPSSTSEAYSPVRQPVLPQTTYTNYQVNNGGFEIRNPKFQESASRPVVAGSAASSSPVFQDQKAKFANALIPGGGFQQATYGNPFNGDNLAQEPCICVPFYLCKNGFLASSSSRNQELQEPIDERSARKNVDAAVAVDARSFESTSDAKNVTLDDAETKKVKRSVNESEVPAYARDVMSRFVGGNSCGLLRRCCRIPPPGGPPGFEEIPPQFQEVVGPAGGDVVSEFNPQFLPDNLAGIPQSQFQPQPGSFGGFPSQGGYVHPSQIINRPSYETRPVPEYVEESVGPVHRPPVSHVSGFGPGSIIPKPSPGAYPGQFIHRPSVGSGLFGGVPPETFVRPNGRPLPGGQPSYPGPALRPKPFRQAGVCGARNAYGIHGRVKNLSYREDSTDFGEYPWQVAILKKIGPGDSLFVCGGTLVSSQWVATAAHCLKKYNVQDLKIRLGEWDVHRDDEFYPYVEKYIGEAIVHPDFFPGNLKNDIALIRLDTPVDLNQPHIAAACLPDPQENFAGKKCYVTGWGKDGFGARGEYQNVLKEVDLPVLDFQDCEYRMRQTRLGPSYQLHPGFLCAGGEPGKDACTGDGGSPLVCEVHGVWKVAGLVSWGIGCGHPGVPGVYVNMAHYREWIESIISHYG